MNDNLIERLHLKAHGIITQARTAVGTSALDLRANAALLRDAATKIECLQAALAPFAGCTDGWMPYDHDSTPIGPSDITVGNIRTAVAAFSRERPLVDGETAWFATDETAEAIRMIVSPDVVSELVDELVAGGDVKKMRNAYASIAEMAGVLQGCLAQLRASTYRNVVMHDFGEGPVAARRHVNPDESEGGWVADSATVAGTAAIGPDAQVFGNAWVFSSAWVHGDARVLGDTWVFGNAQVFGNARVYGDARVFGDAAVHGNAKVFGNAQVSGNAQVYDNALVYGGARVSGNARVFSSAWVHGDARVLGDAHVTGDIAAGETI